MVNRHQVAERIRQVMSRAGMTQKQFAEQLGVSQPAVSLYLQGRIPPPEVLLRIARVGKKNMEWLLTGEPETRPGRVQEATPPYGEEAELLEIWRELPGAVRQNILTLLRHLSR